MTIPFAGWVTACIPHFGCQRYVRRAVESLLLQSYPWIRVLVVNDGDPRPPWRELAGIDDPRLATFNLRHNNGPYFCLEVARRATPDPYFLVQDADDWSAPNRVERLLSALLRDDSDFAVSAQPQVVESNEPKIVEVRWHRSSRAPEEKNFVVQHAITPGYRYRCPHHGLFRSSSLRAIGGYYAGLRISYDTLVPNLILMTGRISHVPEHLYYRFIRPESLTHSSMTGVGSPRAKRELALQRELYHQCFSYYQLFLYGQITSSQFTQAIRNVCAANVTPSQQNALVAEARRLVATLSREKRQYH